MFWKMYVVNHDPIFSPQIHETKNVIQHTLVF